MLLVVLGVAFTGCIEDDFTTSSSDLPEFSTDTLAFDTVLTDVGTATRQFVVYNRHKKMLNISSIKIAGNSRGRFYLNVDGVTGEEFHDVEIRGNDSIFVFVEAFIDPSDDNNPILLEDKLEFVTNGVAQQVVITAWGQNVERLYSPLVAEDTHFTADRPYVIFDTLRVAEGATLTLDAGTRLYFHNKAAMVVDGRLLANGTTELPIDLRGDRIDKVVGDIGFDIMSGQWDGVRFTASSYGNEMRHVYMRGTKTDVQRDIGLFDALGCELSDAHNAVASLTGGRYSFVNCTLGNYYLFSFINEPILSLYYLLPDDNDGTTPLMTANFDNCIFYGLASGINEGDLTGSAVQLRNCLLQSAGEDDDNFIECVWEGDPKFYVVRDEYVFDYRLKNESDAIGKGNPALCPTEIAADRYGVTRLHPDGTIDIGAYTWVEAVEE